MFTNDKQTTTKVHISTVPRKLISREGQFYTTDEKLLIFFIT